MVLLSEILLLLCLAMFVLFSMSIHIKGEDVELNSKCSGETITIPLIVHETPKLSWEASRDNEVLEGGSISIPSSDIEEMNLLITNIDGVLTAKLESVRMRSQNHKKIVLLENANQEDIYTVPVPLGTKDLTFIIKETDNKISLELESVS